MPALQRIENILIGFSKTQPYKKPSYKCLYDGFLFAYNLKFNFIEYLSPCRSAGFSRSKPAERFLEMEQVLSPEVSRFSARALVKFPPESARSASAVYLPPVLRLFFRLLVSVKVEHSRLYLPAPEREYSRCRFRSA